MSPVFPSSRPHHHHHDLSEKPSATTYFHDAAAAPADRVPPTTMVNPVNPSRHGFSSPTGPIAIPLTPPITQTTFAYPSPSLHTECTRTPRHVRLWSLVRPWIPLIAYLSTSLGFVLAIAFWRTELFNGLDELSTWLKTDRFGRAAMFGLIFLTTFPPLPLYSTLIVLAGYTFGALHGAVISYFAALVGAIVVFLISRYMLKDSIACWLASVKSIRRVVRAIERRPQLLFLIRLAPYPYNVMNCLLGASPTLTFRTYVVCTALSLVKVGVHTTIGASLHSFARMHAAAVAGEQEQKKGLGFYWTVGGVALCIGIIVYLAIVARRAVDEELDDDECGGALPTHRAEEVVSFLGHGEEDEDDAVAVAVTPMSERARTPVSADPSRFV